MSGSARPSAGARAVRFGARAVLWLHALVWMLFALGMIAVAATAPEARANPVFLRVTGGAGLAAIGSLGAVFARRWGAALALLGGLGVIAAWIAGDSGRELRLPVAALLAVFALAVAAERRAFLSPPAR